MAVCWLLGCAAVWVGVVDCFWFWVYDFMIGCLCLCGLVVLIVCLGLLVCELVSLVVSGGFPCVCSVCFAGAVVGLGCAFMRMFTCVRVFRLTLRLVRVLLQFMCLLGCLDLC